MISGPQEQLDSDPIYRDFFRPHGLGWSAGTGLQLPTGDNIVFSIERDHSRGPIEKERVELLNELRSHLARSAFVAARLGLQRAKGANEALTAMGLPALLLGQDGTVIEANPLVEDLPGHLQWRATKPDRADGWPRQRPVVGSACGARYQLRIVRTLVSAP